MEEQRSHDGASSRQLGAARLIGKLFGREKNKKANRDEDVATFLQRPSDALCMNGADPNPNGPPKLAKLNTLTSSRWPAASEVLQHRDTSRSRSATAAPRPSRKGLVVRFADMKPEIIGEGGDEAETPTVHISASRKRAQTHPQASATQSRPAHGRNDAQGGGERPHLPLRELRPQPANEISTGLSSITDSSKSASSVASERNNTDHGSLVAKMQKEMKISEGQALIADHNTPHDSAPSRSVGDISSESLSHLEDPRNGQQKASGMDSNIAGRTTAGIGSKGQTQDTLLISPVTSGRYSALPINSETLDEFSERVRHLYKLFNLSAESMMPLSSSSFESLLRAASWWFLRGRTAIEQVAKRRLSNTENLDILLQQGQADLAKCLWILDEVLLQRSEIGNRSFDELFALEKSARANGHDEVARILERYQALYASLRKLTASMKKNSLLPPPAKDAILTQGLDAAIWIHYPWADPYIKALFSGIDPSMILSPIGPDSISSSEALPLGDTGHSFSYNRIHVGVYLDRKGHEPQRVRLPCILSVQRERNDRSITAVISSQDGVVKISIQSKNGYFPSWQDVAWDLKREFMDVKLENGFGARVLFPPGDLAVLWNMYDYTNKVRLNFRPRDDEALVMETTVRSAQYMPKDSSSRAFPKEEVLHCKVRVFERTLVESSGIGSHTRHRGLRIAVITGPNTRSMCGLSHELPTQRPIRFEHMRLDYGSSLFLYLDDGPPATLNLTFETNQDRWVFHNYLIGGQRPNESTAAVLPLKSFCMAGASDSDFTATRTVLDSFEWHAVHVIIHNKGADANARGVQSASHYRIIAESKNNYRVTDRLIIGSGELKIRINTRGSGSELIILREPQQDMTISCPESKTSTDTRHGLSQLLGLVSKLPTVRKYVFAAPEDLHEFQRALTGCNVRYDGTASSFSISRRRMVVPIHKKWDALHARVQVVENDGIVQIAAFFEDFSHGECMNFAVKATDAFESFAKSGGKFGVKLTDAKFALPKQDEAGGAENAFVTLDLLEYPAEHDDIMIIFDTEDGMLTPLLFPPAFLLGRRPTFYIYPSVLDILTDAPYRTRPLRQSPPLTSKDDVSFRHHKAIKVMDRNPAKRKKEKNEGKKGIKNGETMNGGVEQDIAGAGARESNRIEVGTGIGIGILRCLHGSPRYPERLRAFAFASTFARFYFIFLVTLQRRGCCTIISAFHLLGL